jgi:hypothetical protein
MLDKIFNNILLVLNSDPVSEWNVGWPLVISLPVRPVTAAERVHPVTAPAVSWLYSEEMYVCMHAASSITAVTRTCAVYIKTAAQLRVDVC